MKNKRLIVYGLILIVSILLVMRQQKVVMDARSKEKLSNYSEWQKKGKPVNVEQIEKRNVKVYTKITAVPITLTEFQSYVSRSIQQRLKPNQEFYIDGENRDMTGKVVSVEGQVDIDTGLYKVKLAFNEGIKTSRKTMVVYVNTAKVDNAICISNDVIGQTGENAFVWVARSGKAEKQEIKIQQRDGYGTIVSEGLNVGDWLIVDGYSPLADGDKLNILSSQIFEEQ